MDVLTEKETLAKQLSLLPVSHSGIDFFLLLLSRPQLLFCALQSLLPMFEKRTKGYIKSKKSNRRVAQSQFDIQ